MSRPEKTLALHTIPPKPYLGMLEIVLHNGEASGKKIEKEVETTI